MRWVCKLLVDKIWAGLSTDGTHSATPWFVGWLTTCTLGAGRYRSRRFAIPSDDVRGRSWTVSDCVADGRDASAIPSVFGVHQDVGLGILRW